MGIMTGIVLFVRAVLISRAAIAVGEAPTVSAA